MFWAVCQCDHDVRLGLIMGWVCQCVHEDSLKGDLTPQKKGSDAAMKIHEFQTMAAAGSDPFL